MIVEINEQLINLDNMVYSKMNANRKELYMRFISDIEITLSFDSIQKLQTAYQTIKLFETVIKSK